LAQGKDKGWMRRDLLKLIALILSPSKKNLPYLLDKIHQAQIRQEVKT